MQKKYKAHFPNARQHITAVPPCNKNDVPLCDDLNKLLQKLAKSTESNFISTKVFKDKNTVEIRSNTMESDGYHYNTWGVRTIAKGMKKRIFSEANINSEKLKTLKSPYDDKLAIKTNYG